MIKLGGGNTCPERQSLKDRKASVSVEKNIGEGKKRVFFPTNPESSLLLEAYAQPHISGIHYQQLGWFYFIF